MTRSNCVDLIYESDKEALFELRAQAYKKNYNENVDLSALKWSPWDQRFINLGVFENNSLVSLLRIAHVKELTDYKKIMLCELDSAKIELPVVILSRAATHDGKESQGLHSLLRLHALRLAKLSGVKWVTGTFQKDAKRIAQLESMGYELTTNPTAWSSFLKSNGPTYIATLNLETSFAKAENRLLMTAESLIEKYPARYENSVLIERMRRA
jgi:hypothetical protein